MAATTADPFSFLSLSAQTVQPPITSNSVRNFPPEVIEADAAATRVVIHPRFPGLLERFLAHKRASGSGPEKGVYGSPQTFRWRDLVARLLAKRALVFVGSADDTVLRSGAGIRDGTLQWDRNGTDSELLNRDLRLEDYLSYDEIMLGSLLGVSGPSYFVNAGARNNCGRVDDDDDATGRFEERGVIIGLVGARFEREDRMDSVFILPRNESGAEPTTRMHPDLRDIFLDFFAEGRHGRCLGVGGRRGFHEEMYKARIRITADVLLLEANARAREQGRFAYVYVVGLGLGVWEVDERQAELYVQTFGEAMEQLALESVRTVEFAWIDVAESTVRSLKGIGREKDIRVLFSRRHPAAKLEGEGEGEGEGDLLVLSYAWDGNSFPGNEYWAGSLMASGDPAAACMSTIGELHNPVINPAYLKRIAVGGERV